nr:hypothetical protein [Segatella bryantii]
MKMGNWMNLQPVGNSDRFVRKVPGWSKESCHTRYVGSGYSGHWEVLDKE